MSKRVKSHRLGIALVVFLSLTVILGVMVVPVEQAGDATTKFGGVDDGLWWAITTVTGVGYGDLAPTTGWGRIIGAILETIGVTSFGLVIAFITINLLRREQQYYWGRQTERFDRLETRLEEIRRQMSFSLENGQEKKK